jgi:phage regulator Rha-like protein
MYRAGGRNVADRQAKREWRRFLSPCHGFYGEEGNQPGRKHMTKRSFKTKSLDLIVIEQEPRIDSRLMADRLGIQHRSFFRMISKHESIVKEFGILRFEIAEIDGRGQPQRYTFLNEDQSIFILTLSKNTDQVISLKRDLTKEFSRYRAIVLKEARAFRRQGRLEFQQARLESKVERRELTDAIKRLKELADEQNPE